MSYTLRVKRPAARDLGRLTAAQRRRVSERTGSLATDPRPRGSKKLAGTADAWRIRVGNLRVVYRIDDDNRIVRIVRVRHRKDVYDRLDRILP